MTNLQSVVKKNKSVAVYILVSASIKEISFFSKIKNSRKISTSIFTNETLHELTSLINDLEKFGNEVSAKTAVSHLSKEILERFFAILPSEIDAYCWIIPELLSCKASQKKVWSKINLIMKLYNKSKLIIIYKDDDDLDASNPIPLEHKSITDFISQHAERCQVWPYTEDQTIDSFLMDVDK